MVYLRALSGARRDRLQTPLKSVVGAVFCAFVTPGFSAVCANITDAQASAAIATIELTSRLRILKTPWWFGFLQPASVDRERSIDQRNPHRAAPHTLCRWLTRLC